MFSVGMFQSCEDGHELCGIDKKADELGEIETVDEKGFEHETIFVFAETGFNERPCKPKKFLSEPGVKRLCSQICFMGLW